MINLWGSVDIVTILPGYPYDGIPRPGLVVPGKRCKLCGRGAVYWMTGHGAWNLDEPLPHFLCYNCGKVFHDEYPRNSKEYYRKHYPKIEGLWKNG